MIDQQPLPPPLSYHCITTGLSLPWSVGGGSMYMYH